MGKVTRIYSRREVENAFLEAFDRVGGVDRLVAWASREENFLEFLKLMTKFAPKEEMSEKGSMVINYVSSVPRSPLNRSASAPAKVDDAEDGIFISMDQP